MKKIIIVLTIILGAVSFGAEKEEDCSVCKRLSDTILTMTKMAKETNRETAKPINEAMADIVRAYKIHIVTAHSNVSDTGLKRIVEREVIESFKNEKSS